MLTCLHFAVDAGFERGPSEHDVDHLGVAREQARIAAAWVALEILPRCELERVDEDGRDDHVAGPAAVPRGPHQRGVPVVQRPHRRDECDPAAPGAEYEGAETSIMPRESMVACPTRRNMIKFTMMSR